MKTFIAIFVLISNVSTVISHASPTGPKLGHIYQMECFGSNVKINFELDLRSVNYKDTRRIAHLKMENARTPMQDMNIVSQINRESSNGPYQVHFLINEFGIEAPRDIIKLSFYDRYFSTGLIDGFGYSQTRLSCYSKLEK